MSVVIPCLNEARYLTAILNSAALLERVKPLQTLGLFGARDFDGTGERKIHNHRFLGANTGLPWLLSLEPRHKDDAEAFRKAADEQAAFLRDRKLRIDVFGLREGGSIDGKLIAEINARETAGAK